MSNYFQKILIIDDDTVDRMDLKKRILQLDLATEITEAESGIRALDMLTAVEMNHQKFPELIFLDQNMPSMDGFQFLDAFSKHHFSIKNRYRIVMMSSVINDERKKKALQHECVIGYYPKPITEQMLLELKDKFLHSNAS